MKKLYSLLLILLCSYDSYSQTLNWDWINYNQMNVNSLSSKSVTDSEGNVYVGGAFISPTMTIGPYTLNNTSTQGYQVFIAKYNVSGEVVWARTYVHLYYSSLRSMKIDSNDNLLITGDYEDSVTFDNITLTNLNHISTYLAKILPNGVVSWALGIGGPSFASQLIIPFDIASDINGNVYLAGRYTNVPLAVNENITLPTNGPTNYFIVKFNQFGTLQWARNGYMAGNLQWTLGIFISVDNAENVFVTGSFTGTLMFGNTSVSTSTPSSIFLLKYNSFGQVFYLKKYGNSGHPNDIELDSNNNIYITGVYYGSTTFGTILLGNSGYSDGFLTKFTSIGNVVWAKKFGGFYHDHGNEITINGDNLYLVGEFNSPTLTLDSFTLTNGIIAEQFGTENGFIAKYDLNGGAIAATSAINTGTNNMNSISSYNNFIYTSGYFTNNFTLGTVTLSSTVKTFYVAKLNTQTLGLASYSSNFVSIYPNPVKDILNINLIENKPFNYKITDMIGRKIMEGITINNINIAHLNAGTYVLSVQERSVKFVKE